MILWQKVLKKIVYNILMLIILIIAMAYAQDNDDTSAEAYEGRASEILQHDKQKIEALRKKQIEELDIREKAKKFEEQREKKDPYMVSSSELQNRNQIDEKKEESEEANKVKEAMLQKVKEKEKKENEKQEKEEHQQDEADDTFRKWLKTKGPLRNVITT